MPRSDEAMAQIVESLITKMEAGADTWEMPWRSSAKFGLPHNGISHRRYTGGNVLVLWGTQAERDYPTPEWATYQQWSSVGGQVRKGEKSTAVMLWKRVERKDESAPEVAAAAKGEDRGGGAFARVFNVFNAAQVDGLPAVLLDQNLETANLDRDLELDTWADAVPATMVVARPHYNSTADRVGMPTYDTFTSIEGWFGTLAHELAHWTGHSTRLNRTYGKRFGDEAYAFEELVAELSSAFTCAEFRVTPPERSDHAAYLGSWIRGLREQPSILWSVASKAQAATKYLNEFSKVPITVE